MMGLYAVAGCNPISGISVRKMLQGATVNRQPTGDFGRQLEGLRNQIRVCIRDGVLTFGGVRHPRRPVVYNRNGSVAGCNVHSGGLVATFVGGAGP